MVIFFSLSEIAFKEWFLYCYPIGEAYVAIREYATEPFAIKIVKLCKEQKYQNKIEIDESIGLKFCSKVSV